MITLARNLTLDRPSLNQPRQRMDLCGPYACDAIETDFVRCRLQVAGTCVVVELPSEAIARHSQSSGPHEVVLEIPGEACVHVETAPVLSQKQQRQAKRWMAEMESFDRF